MQKKMHFAQPTFSFLEVSALNWKAEDLSADSFNHTSIQTWWADILRRPHHHISVFGFRSIGEVIQNTSCLATQSLYKNFWQKKNFTNLGHKFLVYRNLTACLSHLRCFRPLRIQRKRSKPHGPHSLTGRRRQDVTLMVTVGATYVGVAKRDSALQSAVVGVTWVAEVRQWHRRYHESWVL